MLPFSGTSQSTSELYTEANIYSPRASIIRECQENRASIVLPAYSVPHPASGYGMFFDTRSLCPLLNLKTTEDYHKSENTTRLASSRKYSSNHSEERDFLTSCGQYPRQSNAHLTSDYESHRLQTCHTTPTSLRQDRGITTPFASLKKIVSITRPKLESL